MSTTKNLKEAFESLVTTYGGQEPITLQHLASLFTLLEEKEFDDRISHSYDSFISLSADKQSAIIDSVINRKTYLTDGEYNSASKEQQDRYDVIALNRDRKFRLYF